MGIRQCVLCHGEGTRWYKDVSEVTFVTKGLSCEPPPYTRKQKSCDDCYGTGYTIEEN